MIRGLGGEPGIHVRRWKNRKQRMTDDEIISYALERMDGLIGDERGATFITSIALCTVAVDGTVSDTHMFEGKLKGFISHEPASFRIPSFPFASLFFVDEWRMYLGKLQGLGDEEKAKFLTHRERAITAALPWIQEQMRSFLTAAKGPPFNFECFAFVRARSRNPAARARETFAIRRLES